ncbi:MAG: MptD family putative ECF transporter S component [Emergencia sp.]
MSNKLQAKDLINLGLFTVLYFVIGCCVAIPIGFVPIFTDPVPCGLYYRYPFHAVPDKSEKFGMVTIMGILSGLLMGLTGMGLGCANGIDLWFTGRFDPEIWRL